MKIKLFLSIIVLLIIAILLIFNNVIVNTITSKLLQDLPNYRCNNKGLCMKCSANNKTC